MVSEGRGGSASDEGEAVGGETEGLDDETPPPKNTVFLILFKTKLKLHEPLGNRNHFIHVYL